MSGRLSLFLILGSFGALLCGCKDPGAGAADRPARAKVTGAVTYKGAPLADATVIFVPQGHTHGAVGRTDAQGKFSLQTFDPGDGAVPGEFKVTIRKVEARPAPAAESDDAEIPEVPEKSLIPVKYNRPQTSGLTASVAEGQANEFTFELKD